MAATSGDSGKSITLSFAIIVFVIIITFAHVTSAITHGYGTNVFIDAHTWPHNANLVLNILMGLLKMREFLPEVPYLQQTVTYVL